MARGRWGFWLEWMLMSEGKLPAGMQINAKPSRRPNPFLRLGKAYQEKGEAGVQEVLAEDDKLARRLLKQIQEIAESLAEPLAAPDSKASSSPKK